MRGSATATLPNYHRERWQGLVIRLNFPHRSTEIAGVSEHVSLQSSSTWSSTPVPSSWCPSSWPPTPVPSPSWPDWLLVQYSLQLLDVTCNVDCHIPIICLGVDVDVELWPLSTSQSPGSARSSVAHTPPTTVSNQGGLRRLLTRVVPTHFWPGRRPLSTGLASSFTAYK